MIHVGRRRHSHAVHGPFDNNTATVGYSSYYMSLQTEERDSNLYVVVCLFSAFAKSRWDPS